MGVLSSSVSITRYRVEGKISGPFMESVGAALKDHTIREIDNEAMERSVGWTCLETPFKPDFDGSSFVYGSHLVFSLRIDKKSIPPKIIKKHLNMAVQQRLAQNERQSLSKSEKAQLKDQVVHRLLLRVPAAPNIYDLIWNYEEAVLWFLTNLKAANQELETLFSKTFNLSLIRMFPYTAADLDCGLSDVQKDIFLKLSPTDFYRGKHA